MVEKQGNDLYSRTFFSIPPHDQKERCGDKGTLAVLSTSPSMGEKDGVFFLYTTVHIRNTVGWKRSHFSNPEHDPFQPECILLLPINRTLILQLLSFPPFKMKKEIKQVGSGFEARQHAGNPVVGCLKSAGTLVCSVTDIIFLFIRRNYESWPIAHKLLDPKS